MILFSDQITGLNDTSTLPQGFQGLQYFKIIIPYAFKHSRGIEAATKQIDDALGDMLIGRNTHDLLLEVAGIKFRTYGFNRLRVGYNKDINTIIDTIYFVLFF